MSCGVRKRTFGCVHREDSVQPACLLSLIRIFTGHILDTQGIQSILMQTAKTRIANLGGSVRYVSDWRSGGCRTDANRSDNILSLKLIIKYFS